MDSYTASKYIVNSKAGMNFKAYCGHLYHHFKSVSEPQFIRMIDNIKAFEEREGVDFHYWQDENETGRVWTF